MPQVSVIVPNYNHARFLPKRIESILCQSYQDFELILLDDCSTDESRAILQKYAADPRVTIEFNEVNSGSTFKQWNKGVRLARGKYVWIAESDDYADERLLERLVGVLEADEKVTYVYCRSWRVTEDDRLDGSADFYLDYLDPKRWTADYLVDGIEECRNYFVHCNLVPNASAVGFRRSVYDLVGGADESLRLCGDWKLWAEMALEGKVAYISESLNYFRSHPNTVRTKSVYSALSLSESLHVISWMMQRVPPPGPVREKICERSSSYWVAALMSMHVPLPQKRSILRDIMVIDAHPFRRAVLPALRTIGLKVRRSWRELVPKERQV